MRPNNLNITNIRNGIRDFSISKFIIDNNTSIGRNRMQPKLSAIRIK